MAIALIYLVFFSAAGFAIYKGTPLFMAQIKEFSESAPKLAKEYNQVLRKFDKQIEKLPFGIHDKVDTLVDRFEVRISKQVDRYGSKLEDFPSFLIMLSIIPFVTFYFLRDYDKIIDYLLKLVPKKWRLGSERFVHSLDESLGGYVRGQLFVCTLIGILSYIVFLLIDMQYPLLLGIFIGLTNVIPTFGPIIGAIPALLLALTISKTMLLKVFLTIFVLQIIEGNVISPIIMGKSLQIHPLFIMIALVVGERIGGLAGLIFSVPILAILKIAYPIVRTLFTNKVSDSSL